MVSFDDNGLLRFDADRCCQCGACLASCEFGSLARIPAEDGRFAIVWEKDKCTDCKRCVEVCPAPDLPRRIWTEDSWSTIRAAYLGASNDEKRRRSSSSGGVARTLVAKALERGLAAQAYCLVENGAHPWVKGAYIGPEYDTDRISRSTYRPIPFLENCRPLPEGTSLVAVGTNCQLLAMERFYEGGCIDLYKICILCKQQKHEGFTRFVRRRLGLPREESEPPEYRGNGWPGSITIEGRRMAWVDAAALPFGRGLWTVPGCRLCANAFGAEADLTIADPWEIVTEEEAKGGLSLIAVRTEAGERLLETGKDAMTLNEVEIEAIKRSVDWRELQKKIEAIPVRMGESGDSALSKRVRIIDRQRSRYERLLDRFAPPGFILKILNRLWREA